jgi:hypothetical protein
MSARRVLLAAVLPSLALSQNSPLALPNGRAPRPGANEQLDQLSARVDRDLAEGRISPAQATEDHRRINAIEDEVSADREEHGGRLTDSDRFDIEAQIERLRDSLRRERTTGPAN